MRTDLINVTLGWNKICARTVITVRYEKFLGKFLWLEDLTKKPNFSRMFSKFVKVSRMIRLKTCNTIAAHPGIV